MNFFEKCKHLMDSTKEFKDLKDDFDNLNKWDNLVRNYADTPKETITNFIIKVRTNNIVFTVSKQLPKLVNSCISNIKPRTIFELNFYELFIELKAEYFNIVSKGAYDCIKFIKNLSEDDGKLAERIARFDDSIFNDLK